MVPNIDISRTLQFTVNISDQLCRDVLCTVIEGGYSAHWAGFDRITTVPTADGREYTGCRVLEIDDSGETVAKFPVTLDTIREGFARLINGGMYDAEIKGQTPGSGDAHMDHRMTALRACFEDDGGVLDANGADLILQAAVLGCIRYG